MPVVRSDAGRGSGRVRSIARVATLTRKLAASTANAAAVPAAAISSPPSAGPANCAASTRLEVLSALAGSSRSVASSSGRSAVEAGRKNALAALATAPSTTRCHSRSWSPAASSAMTATASACTRSAASITRRRGSRSLITPPSSISTIRGVARANITSASAVGLDDSCRVCHASATVRTPSPSSEIACPAQSSRKSRSASGRSRPPRSVPGLTVRHRGAPSPPPIRGVRMQHRTPVALHPARVPPTVAPGAPLGCQVGRVRAQVAE
jgi:hypothetical protein